jgi:hypothetical protein
MKTLISLILVAGITIPTQMIAANKNTSKESEKVNTAKTSAKADVPAMTYTRRNVVKAENVFSVNCLLTSPGLFYASELGEKPVMDKVDSLVGQIQYNVNNNNSLDLVVVSAKDLGFKELVDVQWDEILDSALARGYALCPQQTGPELYVLAANKSKTEKLPKLPSNVPVFIGMPQIDKTVSHKVLGFKVTRNEGYVFCLQSQGQNKSYKLGYCTTNKEDENYFWTAQDMFIFAKKK